MLIHAGDVSEALAALRLMSQWESINVFQS